MLSHESVDMIFLPVQSFSFISAEIFVRIKVIGPHAVKYNLYGFTEPFPDPADIFFRYAAEPKRNIPLARIFFDGVQCVIERTSAHGKCIGIRPVTLTQDGKEHVSFDTASHIEVTSPNGNAAGCVIT